MQLWFEGETLQKESSFENVELNECCRIESRERYFEKTWHFESLDTWDKNQD